jgi:hypothetical protein
MPCIMEQFLWVWVTRMLQPLHGVGQPHKVTAFDWTDAHWAEMSNQSRAAARACYAAKQAEAEEKQRQAAERQKAVKQQEDKDIGTFEL